MFDINEYAYVITTNTKEVPHECGDPECTVSKYSLEAEHGRVVGYQKIETLKEVDEPEGGTVGSVEYGVLLERPDGNKIVTRSNNELFREKPRVDEFKMCDDCEGSGVVKMDAPFGIGVAFASCTKCEQRGYTKQNVVSKSDDYETTMKNALPQFRGDPNHN